MSDFTEFEAELDCEIRYHLLPADDVSEYDRALANVMESCMERFRRSPEAQRLSRERPAAVLPAPDTGEQTNG